MSLHRAILFDASIWVGGTSQGKTTNFYGYFSLLTSKEDKVLKVSYPGYDPIEITISDQDPSALLIKLTLMGDLEEVTVIPLGNCLLRGRRKFLRFQYR